MFGRFSKITVVALAVVAVAAGLLLWAVTGSSAGAVTTTTVKLHGNTANIQLSGPTGFGFASANENGIGNDKTTFVQYNSPGAFGFGTVPNNAFKGNPNSATLDTDTATVKAGGFGFGADGPVNFDVTANGFGSKSFSGNQRFGFGGNEVMDAGHRTEKTASGSGTIVSISGSTSGPNNAHVGFQRINRTITTP